SVKVSSETIMDLFKESFPAPARRTSYAEGDLATTANRKWLRCTGQIFVAVNRPRNDESVALTPRPARARTRCDRPLPRPARDRRPRPSRGSRAPFRMNAPEAGRGR